MWRAARSVEDRAKGVQKDRQSDNDAIPRPRLKSPCKPFQRLSHHLTPPTDPSQWGEGSSTRYEPSSSFPPDPTELRCRPLLYFVALISDPGNGKLPGLKAHRRIDTWEFRFSRVLIVIPQIRSHNPICKRVGYKPCETVKPAGPGASLRTTHNPRNLDLQ
jgi:hypothetical protein